MVRATSGLAGRLCILSQRQPHGVSPPSKVETASKKKGPIVADRAMKVWERMPERHNLYAYVCVMLQVRSMPRRLRNLQLSYGLHTHSAPL
jgi:hypothetical protein